MQVDRIRESWHRSDAEAFYVVNLFNGDPQPGSMRVVLDPNDDEGMTISIHIEYWLSSRYSMEGELFEWRCRLHPGDQWCPTCFDEELIFPADRGFDVTSAMLLLLYQFHKDRGDL